MACHPEMETAMNPMLRCRAAVLAPCFALSLAALPAQADESVHAAHALGSVHFPVSCSDAAQREFDGAMALLHHMTYPQARTAFAALAARVSEPGGYFDSDNLISNETSYQHVLIKMRELGVGGGVYLGVGPDQNFTYIAKVRPRMAIIIDIRRDNLLQHLLFKRLFARARNRVEYLCLFMGKPFPKTKGWEQKSIKEIVDYMDATPADTKLFEKTDDDRRKRGKAIFEVIQRRHFRQTEPRKVGRNHMITVGERRNEVAIHMR